MSQAEIVAGKIKPRKEFENWALSYSGMVGNPGGRIWLSGVEYSRPIDEKYKTGDRLKEIREMVQSDTEKFNRLKGPITWDDDFKQKYKENTEKCKKYTSWRTYQKISKVVVAAESDKSGWREYIQKELFAPKGNTFLMNLFPLDFYQTSTDFGDAELEKTGINSKIAYYDWCRANRSKRLRDVFNENKEHIDYVLCFGGFKDDFVSIFAKEYEKDLKEGRCKPIKINKHANDKRTMLCFEAIVPRVFIVPHFACWWWSNKDLEWLGEKIKSK